jgi:hypothetical protein
LRWTRDTRRNRWSLGVFFGLFQTVLHEEVEVVALVEDLALHLGIDLAQPANLAVLLGDELLVHRRDLDVERLLRKVEVGSEELGGLAVLAPLDGKRGRLVLPVDSVEVEKSAELALTLMSKRRSFRRSVLELELDTQVT